MRIRRYFPSDEFRIKEISRTAFSYSSLRVDRVVWNMVKDSDFVSPEVENASKGKDWVFVADDGGFVAGFVYVSVMGDVSEVLGWKVGSVKLIAVDERYRGMGMGRKLLRYGLKHLRSQKVRLVTVYTDTVNTTALNLYESEGFKTTLTLGTYRAYSPVVGAGNPRVSVVNKIDSNVKTLLLMSPKTSSLFYDRRVSVEERNKVLELWIGTVEKLLNLGGLRIYGFRENGISGVGVVRRYEEFYRKTGKVFLFLSNLSVASGMRGRGVGTAIVETVLSSESFDVVECVVPMDCLPMIRVLEKARFKLVHLSSVLHKWV